MEKKEHPAEMTPETAPPTSIEGDREAAQPPPFDSRRPEVGDGHRLIEQVGVFEAMRWHWPLVLIPVVLLAAAGLALGVIRAPVYMATANLSVDFGAQSPSSLPGSVTAAQALADSYARAVIATPVVRQVAGKTGSSATEVADHVSASPIPDSTVVKVSGTAASGQEAIELANASATALTRYIGALNGTRSGSGPVLVQFRQAEAIYQDRLDRQEELAAEVEANPSDQEAAEELKRARVKTQVALLKKNSVAELYGASQQAYVAPLSFLSEASAASSDRIPRLELLVFIGLIAGLAIGAALATVKANRL
jgi:capsular polysaccharide biosynthesis protein